MRLADVMAQGPNATRQVSRFLREEDGLELLEWAIVAVILVGLIGAYLSLRDVVTGMVQRTDDGVRSIGSLQP